MWVARNSPCTLVPRTHGKVRLCNDYRKLNTVTVKDSFPLPRIDHILDAIGNATCLTQQHLLKRYYQLVMINLAKQLSAFITLCGQIRYERLPFGFSSAPAIFQRTVHLIIQDLDDTFAYLDDMVVATANWNQHLQRLYQLFKKLLHADLTTNLGKSIFAKCKMKHLVHMIGSGGIAPLSIHLDTIH